MKETTMENDMFQSWTDANLADIGLARGAGAIEIDIPQDANIYHMTVGAQIAAGHGDAPAMIFEHPDGTVDRWSFADIDAEAAALAAELRKRGYGRGDLIGLHTGMRPETAIAHMAVCKLGATAVTLSQLYGPDALAHALNHCQARCLLSTEAAWAPLRAEAARAFPHLTDVLVSGSSAAEADLTEILRTPAPADFEPDYTGADDAALLMYTSGSTGMPKGILHGHRVLASYRPSISLFFNLSMHDEDAVFWSPSDWAWVGGLLDMLFPAWLAGRPVVTSEARFKADYAYDFMARHKVTHTFLAPTAIKRLAETAAPRDAFDLSLRVICTGGEALAAETLAWAENRLGVVCNEFYGMTEVNHLIGNCAALYPRRPGSMGIAYPGHDVRLVDDAGNDVAVGEQGEIVTPDTAPTRYLGYLRNAEKDAELRLGSFMRTHDLAVRDAEGYFWYKGRSDDLIKSSGFRIGPAEIEECLLAHPAVAEVGVIGKPDADRGSIVKAFVRLAVGAVGDDVLSAELKSHVRDRLAPYKAPREIAYVDDFEMTSSGKINRRALRASETA
ncbi:AMP-binding protein [Shimia sp.]|uniref:AMP-binding protein n=1 Tax=Shimia sp. TaxID=1954381 RepID=UPI003296B5E6